MHPRLRLVLIGLAGCAAAAIAGAWVAAFERTPDDRGSSGWAGALRPPGARVPDFALLDQDGRRITDEALRGRGPIVFTFVYATCEDACPLQVQQIRGALDRLGRDVPVVAVSVDPATDTPRLARRFVLEQHMTGRMGYLLGTEAQLRPVWKAFGIAPQRGDLDHTAHVVVADGEGRQRIGFPVGQLTVDRLANDLRLLGA